MNGLVHSTCFKQVSTKISVFYDMHIKIFEEETSRLTHPYFSLIKHTFLKIDSGTKEKIQNIMNITDKQ
jgi:hypothetical protein